MWKKIIGKLLSLIRIYETNGFDPKLQDDRDFEHNHDDMGGWFGYTPKHTRVDLSDKLVRIHNQKGQVSCVIDSGNAGKEIDEQVALSTADMVFELNKRGLYSSRGTSLSAYQKLLRDRGVAEEVLIPTNYDLSHSQFATQAKQTQESIHNAETHKSKSYWKTTSLNTVLEELDNGRPGHTGSDWYSSYYGGNLKAPYILTPNSGYLIGGHATQIVGYDRDYNGYEVLKVLNSYDTAFGDGGFFYVRFSDFDNVFKYGVYYNEDLDKDALSWAIIRNNVLVKEKGSPDIYLIQNRKKRYIPNEAMMLLVLTAFNRPTFEEDAENMLPFVEKGEDMTMEDIPEWAVQTVKTMVEWSTNKKWFYDTFKKYYPDILN